MTDIPNLLTSSIESMNVLFTLGKVVAIAVIIFHATQIRAGKSVIGPSQIVVGAGILLMFMGAQSSLGVGREPWWYAVAVALSGAGFIVALLGINIRTMDMRARGPSDE